MKTLTKIAALIVTLGFSTGALAVDIPAVLPAGSSILPGQMMVSANGIYELHMQYDDGNLVLRRRYPGGTDYAGWNTGQKGGGTYALMQTDSNFVLYPAGQTTNARWAANGGNQPYDTSYRLVVGADGSIKIYKGSTTDRQLVQTLHTDTCSSGEGRYYTYPVCNGPTMTTQFTSVLAKCGAAASNMAINAGGVLCGTFPLQ